MSMQGNNLWISTGFRHEGVIVSLNGMALDNENTHPRRTHPSKTEVYDAKMAELREQCSKLKPGENLILSEDTTTGVVTFLRRISDI